MKVIVCGGRDWNNQVEVYRFLDLIEHKEGLINIVIHGDCPGEGSVDQHAGMWADRYGLTVRPYPADWKKHGRAAGPIRNRQMLERENPEMVLALPGGNGTRNMIKQAQDKGIKVIRYEDVNKNEI